MTWQNSVSFSRRSSWPSSSPSSIDARPHRRQEWWAVVVIGLGSVLLSTGCGCGHLPPVSAPGEPKIILAARGQIRLATFDEKAGKFIDLGWHDAEGLRGWTLADYDWGVADEEIPPDTR